MGRRIEQRSRLQRTRTAHILHERPSPPEKRIAAGQLRQGDHHGMRPQHSPRFRQALQGDGQEDAAPTAGRPRILRNPGHIGKEGKDHPRRHIHRRRQDHPRLPQGPHQLADPGRKGLLRKLTQTSQSPQVHKLARPRNGTDHPEPCVFFVVNRLSAKHPKRTNYAEKRG